MKAGTKIRASAKEILERQKEFYDEKYSRWKQLLSIKIYWQHLGDQIIRLLNISPGRSYLVVGVGEGELARHIAEKSQAKTVGIDISEVSLKICSSSKLENTVFLFADAQCLPFKNGCFDGIIAPGVLHHLPMLIEALEEFKRVLTEDGAIFSLDPRKYFLRSSFNLIVNRLISKDEVQFRREIIEGIYTKLGFRIVFDTPLYLFIPILVPLLRRIGCDKPTRLFRILLTIDSFANKFPFNRLSWIINFVVRLEK